MYYDPVRNAVRSKSRRRDDQSSEESEDSRRPIAPIAAIFAGLALAGRAVAFPETVAAPFASPLLVARIVLPLCLSAWGCLFFFQATHSRLVAWVAGDARSSLLILWATALSMVNALSGVDQAAFVVGVVYASVIAWDRLARLVILAASGFVLIALSSVAAPIVTSVPFRPGDLLVAAASAGAAIAVARTVRSYVAPGRERLRSLERENKQLWDLSFKDTLTGLYNRRFAQETGRALISRSRRYHEDLHIFMLDIDHFKRVNDELSHAIGDEVLKGVAQTVQSCLRTSDSVARYGGEEFLAFVVQAEAEVAQFIANRIREAIATKKFESVPWPITISIGVASATGDDDLDELIDRADKYLYASKRGGRNRVSGF